MSNAPPPSPGRRHHDVILPNGDAKRYFLLGLIEVGGGGGGGAAKGDDDDDNDNDNDEMGGGRHGRQHDDDAILLAWARMCASSFAYKSNPPSSTYFARHYYNDPRRDMSLIRVMTTTSTTSTKCHDDYGVVMDDDDLHMTMASSVRIFRRTLSCGAHGGDDATVRRVEAGGIGEVCTHPDHRGRGLSSILMRDAMDVMVGSRTTRGGGGGMACSFLHASSDFRRYYNRIGGYVSVTSERSVVDIELPDLALSSPLARDVGGGGGARRGHRTTGTARRRRRQQQRQQQRHETRRISAGRARPPSTARRIYRKTIRNDHSQSGVLDGVRERRAGWCALGIGGVRR